MLVICSLSVTLVSNLLSLLCRYVLWVWLGSRFYWVFYLDGVIFRFLFFLFMIGLARLILRLTSVCKEFLEAVFYTLWWFIWCFRKIKNFFLFYSVKPKKNICCLIRLFLIIMLGPILVVRKLVSIGFSGYKIIFIYFLKCNCLFCVGFVSFQ